jgi:nitrate reductase gamma subunit
MKIISSILFIILTAASVWWFSRNVGKIRRNILLGRDEDLTDQPSRRWNTMFRVAFGQTKMFWRPIPAILHFIVYAGFLLINIEVLEIIIDGIFGTHRIFMEPLGNLYLFAIGFFEICAVLVLLACVFFLTRRYVQKLKRLNSPEMDGWPRKDATVILFVEIVLMGALLLMNATDRPFQQVANMPVSSLLAPLFSQWTAESLHLLERTAWWFHIIGIFAFLNYLPFSKHFHIILAFPNTWYTTFKALVKFSNMSSVTNEVKMMLDPASADPRAEPPSSFGAKYVKDLSWKNLMDAY